MLGHPQVAYSSRDLHYVTLFAAGGVNAVLSKVLKRTFRQPRPSAMCDLLGNCDDYGLPSSHAQIVTFSFALTLALCLRSFRSAKRLERHKLIFEVTALGLASVLTGYARVRLGYHSVFQVLLGAAVGFTFALMVDQVLAYSAATAGKKIQRSSLAKALGLQNSLWPAYFPDKRQRAKLRHEQ